MLVSAFGSTAVTSDYDFNIFIVDNAEIVRIEQYMTNYLLENHFDQVLIPGQRLRLTKERLILAKNKLIFFQFARMMMRTFSEVSAMVKEVYDTFEVLIKSIELIAVINPNDANQVEHAALDLINPHIVIVEDVHDNLACVGLAKCYDSNAYPDTMTINMLLFRLPLALLKQDLVEGDLAFDVKDMIDLDREYMNLSVASLCDYSMLPLTNAQGVSAIHGEIVQKDCNYALRNQSTIAAHAAQDRHIGVTIMLQEIRYLKEEDDLCWC